MNRFFIFLIRIYQIFLAPWFGGRCRFVPSCSVYAKEVFEHEKFITAFLFVSKRLLRCHPFGGCGLDQVSCGRKKI